MNIKKKKIISLNGVMRSTNEKEILLVKRSSLYLALARAAIVANYCTYKICWRDVLAEKIENGIMRPSIDSDSVMQFVQNCLGSIEDAQVMSPYLFWKDDSKPEQPENEFSSILGSSSPSSSSSSSTPFLGKPFVPDPKLAQREFERLFPFLRKNVDKVN